MIQPDPLADGVSRPILFVFDDAVVSSKNLRRIFHTPRKSPANPVLRPEKPWEGSRIETWGSVLPWEGRWRLLYNSWSAAGDGGIHVLESRDGKEWHRPNLGLHAHGECRETNILWPGTSCASATN